MSFFGGPSMPVTPAQQQLLHAFTQQQQNFQRTWLPVQNYYANYVQQTYPAQKVAAEGLGAASARTRGGLAGEAIAARDASRAGTGSGKFISDLGATSAATGGLAGGAETAGDLSARKAYEEGLARVLQLGRSDQQLGLQGLNTAAQTQEAEAAQEMGQQQGALQGAGQLAGLAGAVAGMGK